MEGRMSRRGFLRGVGAGALVLGGASLAGCSGLGASAAPKSQKPKILLVLRAWGYGSTTITASESTVLDLQYQATAPWRAAHPGVDIKVTANTGGPGQVISEILAGIAPDIYHSYHPDELFTEPGYTTDLTKYLQDAHANLNVFNAAQMDLFRQPNGIRALPAYLGIETLAMNLGLIDSMGLPRPDPGWDYQAYSAFCKQIASGSQGKVVGGGYALGTLGAPTGYLPAPSIMHGFGGSYVDPTDSTRCALDSPEVASAVNWAYALGQAKAVSSPSQGGSFHEGTIAMPMAATWALIYYATTWGGLNWTFFDLPTFPKVQGPLGGCTSDFYALNPGSKHLDLAWDLLNWMSFEPYWQRQQMRIFLLSPALLSLWEEWAKLVTTYAPPLANKNLEAFVKIALGGHTYPNPLFRYQTDAAIAYMNTWGAQMWSQQVSVQEGLMQMTHQINGLEKAGAAEAVANSKPAPKGEFPAPTTVGLGDPYTNGSPYIVVNKTTGLITMLGTGYDIYNSQDACVFYCESEVAQKGSWICRVDSVSNISCPTLSVWAKAGLMARTNLSDDCKMAALHVTGANGIEWEYREVTGTTPGSQGQLVPKGLKGTMMKPVNQPTANFLTQPIWLRMDRDKYTWTAYASLDGKTWDQMGTPITMDMGGCWMGVMATAHNGDFSDKGYIRATFDKLNFTPTKMVQLGVTGVAPAGGPVPTNWATMTTAAAPTSTTTTSA